MGKPVQRRVAHGTLYRYSIVYTDLSDPGIGELRKGSWAYNQEHALQKFYEAEDSEGWTVLRIARVQEGAGPHRWTWHEVHRNWGNVARRTKSARRSRRSCRSARTGRFTRC